jgi:hypothetical protein
MDSAMSRRQAIDAESKFQKPHIAAPAFALADRVVVADLGKRRAKTPIVPRGVWTGGQPYADLGKRRSGPVELCYWSSVGRPAETGKTCRASPQVSADHPRGHPPICLRVPSGSETPVPMLAQAVTRIWTRCVIRTDCRDIILGASSIALGSVDLHGRSVLGTGFSCGKRLHPTYFPRALE